MSVGTYSRIIVIRVQQSVTKGMAIIGNVLS